MTLEELLIKEEIKELRSKYSHYCDLLQYEKMEELITDDIVFEAPQRWGGSAKGKAALIAFMKEKGGRHIPGQMFHLTSTPVIELIDENNATGRWYLLDYDAAYEEKLRLIGIYHDRYRKENGVWKFSYVSVHTIWPDRWPE